MIVFTLFNKPLTDIPVLFDFHNVTYSSGAYDTRTLQACRINLSRLETRCQIEIVAGTATRAGMIQGNARVRVRVGQMRPQAKPVPVRR